MVLVIGSDRDGPSIFATGACMYDATNDFVILMATVYAPVPS